MTSVNQGKLEKKYWREVRQFFHRVDPKLAKIIDDIDLTDEHCFYQVRYPYGADIVNRGTFHIPNSDGAIVPLNDASVDEEVKRDLTYSRMLPTGLVTHNSLETFFTAEDHTIPVSLYGEGDYLALWHLLEGKDTYQTGPVWSVSSGARTVMMVPKISDKTAYKSLKIKYGLNDVPSKTVEHFDIFKFLANHKDFGEEWYSEVIYFSKKWFEDFECSKLCRLFNYFYQGVWKSSSFRRNQFIANYAFSVAQSEKGANLKPNPYLADTVKHLFAVADGTVPGFVPGTDDKALPVKRLQSIFVEDYGLKYCPIIVHPHHFNFATDRPVYYSLALPTTTVFSPRSSKTASRMSDMRELKHITGKLQKEIIEGKLLVEDTPLLKLSKSVTFHFYHKDIDNHNEINNALQLEELDDRFTTSLCPNAQNEFPEFSTFFRGCISISGLSDE